MMKNGPFPSLKVPKVNANINHKSNGRWDLWTVRPCALANVWVLAPPFPAHLRENRDLGTGSTGTKCFQIKIVFPSALLACFVPALHHAGFQTCSNLFNFLFSTYIFVVRFLDSVTVSFFSLPGSLLSKVSVLSPGQSSVTTQIYILAETSIWGTFILKVIGLNIGCFTLWSKQVAVSP